MTVKSNLVSKPVKNSRELSEAFRAILRAGEGVYPMKCFITVKCVGGDAGFCQTYYKSIMTNSRYVHIPEGMYTSAGDWEPEYPVPDQYEFVVIGEMV